ncbi:unnamed protein product, partial [Lymnaea stagnalis]
MIFYACLTTLFVAVLTQDIPSRRRKTWDTSEDETSPLPPPSFRPTPDRVTFKEGQMAKLECSVDHIGTKQVIWRRKSDPNPLTIGRRTFVDDERVSVQHVPLEPDWHLLIKQVRFDDAGEYECQISSVDRQLRKPVQLTVKREWHLFKTISNVFSSPEIKITGTTFVDQGHKIKLVCNATGGAQVDEIDWFRNGQKLVSDNNRKVSIHKRVSLMEMKIDSILEVEEADMDDAGIYVCRTSGLLIDSKRVDVLNGTHF